MTIDRELTPRMKKVIARWFEKYSEEGKMSKEKCAEFNNSCTGKALIASDREITNIFNQHDKDHDGFLLLEDFLRFYKTSVIQNPGHVNANLRACNYREDLMNWEDLEEENAANRETTPGHILTENEENF